MVENVPRPHHVNPARRSRHRRHRRQTCKPLISAPDRLVTPVRQHKINRRRNRLPIHPQQLVRRGVTARRMRRHPKTSIPSAMLFIRQRLKLLRLFMDRSPAPPPPRLVHKRPMRRVHQPDNPMVHVARQVSLQMRTTELPRKLRHLRHRRQCIAQGHTSRPHLRQIHPRKPIPLHARISTRVNLRGLQPITRRQRRNLLALPSARLKLPPVILALHRLPIEPPCRKRNPAMRTKIPHRKQSPIPLPPQHQRNPKQQRLRHLPHAQHPNPQSRIPIPKNQLRRRPPTHPELHQLTHTKQVYPPHPNHPSEQSKEPPHFTNQCLTEKLSN